MVRLTRFRRIGPVILSLIYLLTLTGCPGAGDRMRFDETARVSGKGDDVCLSVTDARDYQPVDMGINLRGTPSKEKEFNFSPGLRIVDGTLCIPSSYYHFINGKEYIVEFVMHSIRNNEEPRSFVVGVGVKNNHVYNFPLTAHEIARPYGSVETAE